MKRRVLVAEDDLAVLEVLELMLSDTYEVITATNGREAIEAYFNYKPDIVLMDIIMPDVSGIEATKEILKKDPNAKILALTAFALHKGKEMLEAGALEIIEKPFTKKQLIEKIESYLKK
jgi:CheY-like chemotaxis protein